MGEGTVHRESTASKRQELKIAAAQARDLMEDLRLMPLGMSHSESYGIVERWEGDDGHLKYGRDLAEWIGAEGDETARKFTQLIVVALNMLPSLLRVLDESHA